MAIDGATLYFPGKLPLIVLKIIVCKNLEVLTSVNNQILEHLTDSQICTLVYRVD